MKNKLETIKNIVTQHFHGDIIRSNRWFETINPLLGDISPNEMIQLGRIDKLEKFINISIDERGKK